MRLLYITNPKVDSQGDFQEVTMLHGLRAVMRQNCIDWPRKKIMYGDFSESPKHELHGIGFTLYNHPISEVTDRRLEDIDVVLYGVTNAYGVTDYPEINALTPNVFYLDGHDGPSIQKKPCFKREMFWEQEGVYPTGFGIPEERLRKIDWSFPRRSQMYQRTAPPYSLFGNQVLGMDCRGLYTFRHNQEEAYYNDMADSWFGLTCMKGGWDSLRHYEIMAAGSLLLFRDYDKKPPLCSPQNLPCFSYSTLEELKDLMERLVVNCKPTAEYTSMLLKQRIWLNQIGTTEARAQSLIKTIKDLTNVR